MVPGHHLVGSPKRVATITWGLPRSGRAYELSSQLAEKQVS